MTSPYSKWMSSVSIEATTHTNECSIIVFPFQDDNMSLILECIKSSSMCRVFMATTTIPLIPHHGCNYLLSKPEHRLPSHPPPPPPPPRIDHNKAERAGTGILWENNSFIWAVALPHIFPQLLSKEIPHLEQLILRSTCLANVKVIQWCWTRGRGHMSAWGHCLAVTSGHVYLYSRIALMSKRADQVKCQLAVPWEIKAADVRVEHHHSVSGESADLLPSVYGCRLVFSCIVWFPY